MPISEATYERVALEDSDGVWELVCGRLVEKPPMTAEHENLGATLVHYLNRQLELVDYSVRANSGRLRVPDVCVIPRTFVDRLEAVPGTFEVYGEPMPLVVEVWPPSTGATDLRDKLAEYQQRGDREIWYIHPYERALTAWRRRPDGSYAEARDTGGTVEAASLPGVVIKLDSLFQ